jgi:DNA-binding NarL/FixJ family response regulator
MPRILLADDYPVVRRQVREILETEPGFSVCAEASNGLEAVTLTVSRLPDIAILDLSMPQMNGLEAARQIHQRFALIDILILTMYDPSEFMEEVIAAGVRTCILKTDLDRLVATIRNIWEERQSRNCGLLSDHTPETANDSLVGDGIEPAPTLTQFERQIVQMLAQAKSNKDIADTLSLTVKAVELQRETIMRKLEISSFFDLVQYAMRKKLIETKSTVKPFVAKPH